MQSVNRFVMVFAPPGRLRPATSRLLDRADPAELPFQPTRHVRWASPDGTAHYAGWEAGAAAATLAGADGLTAWAGTPRPHRGNWPSAAPVVDTLHAAAHAPAWRPRHDLADAYAVAHIDQRGAGFVAMDPLGLHPLYIAEGAEATVVGNRADLVAHTHAAQTGQPARKSVVASSWLAFAGQHVADMTGFDHVRTLTHDHVLRVHAGRTTTEATPAAFETAGEGGEADPVEVAEALWADVEAGLRHMIARSDEPPHVELTGGKDSRLLLAVAIGADLTDSLRFVTYGPAAIPDMRVATLLAQRFALDHHDTSAAHYLGAVHFTRADRFRRHVHRSCGASQCGDANEPDAHRGGVASGHIGELFRATRRADGVAPSDAVAVDAFLGRRRFGAAGLLRDDHRRARLHELTDYFLAARGRVRTPDELEAAFIMRCRYARWQGPLVDLHDHTVLPMYAPATIAAACRMGSEAHHLELVHHHVISRGAPALEALPFANDRWRGPDMTSTEPVTGPKSAKQTAAANSRTTQVAHDLVAGHAAGALWPLLDRAGVDTTLAAFDTLHPYERQQVLGMVAAMIWLGDDEATSRPDWRDGADPGQRTSISS